MKTRILIAILMLGSLGLYGQAAEDEQVDAWSDSPAKVKLERIEQYQPAVRRSRTTAIRELENDLQSARTAVDKAESILADQISMRDKGEEGAWDSTKFVRAEEELFQLQAYIQEAETFLAYAKSENEKVLKYLVRERRKAAVSSGGEEGAEEVDDDEGVETDPQLRMKTRLSPTDEEEDVDDDEELDIDN